MILIKMKNFHDVGYKKLFSNPVYLEQLLTCFVEEDFIQELDFSTLERLDKSFITEEFKEKESDLIYKINFKEKPIYIFLLLEFQSTVDPYMALRFLRYICEFYQSFITDKKVKKLPAVFPLLLYNGEARWTAPQNINELIETSISSKYIPNFKYYKIAENEFSKEFLEHIHNAVSAIFYLENSDHETIIENIDKLRDYIKNEPNHVIDLFSNWLGHYIKYHDLIAPEDLSKLIKEGKEIKPMLESSMKRFNEELKQQGMLENKHTVLIRQMNKKFGLSSVEKRAILKCKDGDLLDKALDEFVFADSKEQVLSIIFN